VAIVKGPESFEPANDGPGANVTPQSPKSRIDGNAIELESEFLRIDIARPFHKVQRTNGDGVPTV
jgi:hypothetical protein